MNAHVDRRRFLVWSSAAAGALALGFVPLLRKSSSGPWAADNRHERRPAPWLTLDATGRARLTVPFTELGQGVLLGITQLVAEELDLPLAAFTTVTAPMEARFLVKDAFYTGGSGSIRPLFEDWRYLGASARALLVAAAAERFGVSASACRTEQGTVIHPNGRERLGYGALAAAADDRALPQTVVLRTRADWCCIGTSPTRPHLPTLVDGSATYGIDTRVPGMWFATLAHAPEFGARLHRVDPAPALAVPGVHAVVPLEAAVAVAADTFWQASRGLASLKPEWTAATGRPRSSADLERLLEAALGSKDATLVPAERSAPAPAYRERVLAAISGAPASFEQSYSGPLIAHATLEPQNTIATVADGRCELHCPTQNQTAVQNEVAAALGFAPERVAVHTTRIGGGFGRRLKADYAVKAALVAKAVGRPVQVLWSRGEDVQHDYYRPAALARLTAALGHDGYPIALRALTAACDDTIVGGMHGAWYGFGPVLVEASEVKSGLPIGAWRSVDASISCFFVESFIDELALRAGIEPLAYRVALARDQPRTRRVLEVAAEHAGWANAGGRALGIAAFCGWNTWVAQVAEVEVGTDGLPRVTRVTCAFDCGIAVNPQLVRAQVEGGITMGLSAALKERITLEGGRVAQKNFDDYPLLRFNECPRIEVVLLESPGEAVGGAGEPPVPAVAPAVANAIFRLTGERRRHLPLARA